MMIYKVIYQHGDYHIYGDRQLLLLVTVTHSIVPKLYLISRCSDSLSSMIWQWLEVGVLDFEAL